QPAIDEELPSRMHHPIARAGHRAGRAVKMEGDAHGSNPLFCRWVSRLALPIRQSRGRGVQEPGPALRSTSQLRRSKMAYVDGFVAAIPKANKQLYQEHSRASAERIKSWGATRVVENWGDDVPRGETNDFYGAVLAKPDEVVVFSWIEYPDKATRDAVMHKMMSPDGMEGMPETPFDGKRMIFGGFETLFSV